MSLPFAFWDTSALIPLCVSQPETAKARLLDESYGIVAWWATQVEMISGLTRLDRMGQITAEQFFVGKRIARKIVSGWTSIDSTKSIATNACLLLELYPLRAADALQLAAALEWCEGKPNGNVFLSFDQRLREAAARSGFALE
jgi:predicted nucleic acid-binding protein